METLSRFGSLAANSFNIGGRRWSFNFGAGVLPGEGDGAGDGEGGTEGLVDAWDFLKEERAGVGEDRLE
jgi:hypothetical protein